MSGLAPGTVFARHDGEVVLHTAEAIVKGTLECGWQVSTLTIASSEATTGVSQRLDTEPVRAVFDAHRLELHQADDAARAVRLGRWAAGQGGLHVVVAAGAGHVHAWLGTLEATLPQGAGLAIIAEVDANDRPLVLDSSFATLEPGSPEAVRDAVEAAMRMSRAAAQPVVVALSRQIMHSGASVQLRPNHGDERPRTEQSKGRLIRWDRQEPPLRMARRLECNAFRELPSPGETAAVGVITMGQADDVLHQLVRSCSPPPRLPVLRLGVSTPLDEAAVIRLLERCRDVVVIEPLGMSVVHDIRAIADARRQDEIGVASVSALILPDSAAALGAALVDLVDLHSDDGLVRVDLPEPPDVPAPSTGAAAMQIAVRSRVHRLLVEHSEANESVRLELDGQVVGEPHGSRTCVETWTAGAFRRDGAAAVRQSIDARQPWLHLIAAGAPPSGAAVERLAAAFVPPDLDTPPIVQRVPFDDSPNFARAVHEALQRGGVTVLICGDVGVQWDAESRARRAMDADRIGFRPLQRVVQSVDRFCNPYHLQTAGWDAATIDPPVHGAFTVDTIDGTWKPRLAFRIRPQAEMIEVTRTRPPRVAIDGPLPAPVPAHAQSPVWRAHIAGLRGRLPGVAGRVLAAAGSAMGVHVDWRCDPSVATAGRRGWVQIRFEHRPAQGTAAIAEGQADLLLAVDGAGAAHAASQRRLCDPASTHAVLAMQEDDPVAQWFSHVLPGDRCVLADVEETCRRRFHSDRLADMVLLGVAFQFGWIPLTVDAMHAAMGRLEERGIARIQEAFDYGRHAALQPSLLSPERTASPIDTPVRRARRWGLLSLRTPRGAGDRLGALLDRTLRALPGLAHTDDGRAMRGLLVDGLAAASIWGGIATADSMANDVLALYTSDREDTGHALTRAAIGPLVSTLLMQDPIYVARMAVSPGHRAALRRVLDVRPARGDVMDMRYVTRFECVIGDRNMKLDVRTSEWLAWIGVGLGRLVPLAWRGSPRQRAIRTAVRGMVQQATTEAADRYDHWRHVLEALREAQHSGALTAMSGDDLRALAQVSDPSPHA
ncbi:MAG: hypothetical protein MK074_00375 [Phycisphaerales bacterium]|nr:hypothetical protein [Phycisphaerales bacterium]